MRKLVAVASNHARSLEATRAQSQAEFGQDESYFARLRQLKSQADALKDVPVGLLPIQIQKLTEQRFNDDAVQKTRAEHVVKKQDRRTRFPGRVGPCSAFMQQLNSPSLMPSLGAMPKARLTRFLADSGKSLVSHRTQDSCEALDSHRLTSSRLSASPFFSLRTMRE